MTRQFLLLAGLLCGQSFTSAATESAQAGIENSVVKVFVSMRSPDMARPWNKQASTDVTGTGFVIAGHRILTNAHVVNYASQLQIQPQDGGDKLAAHVEAFAPDVDLAVLKLDDDNFFQSHKALEIDGKLPKGRDEVLVYGYPVGGNSQSTTKGIVSRVEFAPFNALGGGLRIQVDASINPGNSGGPVVSNGRAVGVAFSSLVGTQNINYVISAEEVQMFLKDIEDGRYDGKPYLFVNYQTLENPALRSWLKLGAGVTGVVVRRLATDGFPTQLQNWDVITKIGDTAIDDQGMIPNGDGQRLRFVYLTQKLAKGGKLPLTIVRDGKTLTVQEPVSNERVAQIRDLRGTYPPFFIYGPMIFSVATTQFLASSPRTMAMLAASSTLIKARLNPPNADRQELVVVAGAFFSHRITAGYGSVAGQVLETVNGVHIKSLAHLVTVLRDSKEEFVVFGFDQGMGESLVFKRAEMGASTEEILTDNGIRAQGSAELMAIWQGKSGG